MSFYQTNNSSIVRFNVRDPAKKIIAPFANLQRVVQIQRIGAGYLTTGASFTAGGNLTPEQLQNGAIIVNPSVANGGVYVLPSAYSLQEYIGGRDAFNMAANQVNVGAGANPMTGLNSYFLLNVYNLSIGTGIICSFSEPNVERKVISAAAVANDSVLTPVLIQFEGVYSPYATINGVANTVSYNIF